MLCCFLRDIRYWVLWVHDAGVQLLHLQVVTYKLACARASSTII